MIKLSKAKPAPKAKTLESQKIAYIFAGILVILAFCQLFNFGDFLKLLVSFNFPGGKVIAYLTGGLIVTIEVFSLPFLLRLKLSQTMRVVSMVCSWLVPLAWLKLALWLVLTSNTVANFGILGTVVKLTPGWWAVFVSIAIGILSVWVSWGLWPISAKKHSKN